ncbi:hypothetical protein KHP62_12640 [Rhodobacteraceae bacterium NNCM2]|nr:hypothetical protein [Coraliihabitans acroporae]
MVAALEILVYLLLAAALWFAYHRMSDGGRNRRMVAVFAAGAVGIAAVILSGIDWNHLIENWRDIAANALVALAVFSIILGYARLLRYARRKAEKRDDK